MKYSLSSGFPCIFWGYPMVEISEEPKLSLRLFVDEGKQKAVLAEANKDFVDVLFSFLTLPMGNIVRLLEKHRKSQPIVLGCFNNLYRSVENMGTENFLTEACKHMLLYPRSVIEDRCGRLKVNINETETKHFVCPMFSGGGSCSNLYSTSNTSRCSCGRLMDREITLPEREKARGRVGNDADGVFVGGRTSFIITDDLKVTSNTTSSIMRTLRGLGHGDVDKLEEMTFDFGFDEVQTLFECLFISDSLLTDTFLRKRCSCYKARMLNMPSNSVQENGDDAESDQVITLDVFLRKQDNMVLYVECEEDFVDLLFSFLALPLEFMYEICGSNVVPRCIGNLRRSFKGLRGGECLEASSYKRVLPPHYSCQKQLLGVMTHEPPVYYRYYSFSSLDCWEYGLTDDPYKPLRYKWDKAVPVTSMDPRTRVGGVSTPSIGFVRRNRRFVVLDNLTVEPMNSTSVLHLLKTLDMCLDDLKEHKVCISREEAISLLRASLVTSSALTFGLRNFLAKQLKDQI